MKKKTQSEMVYHYTSAEGLHGILSSGTLYFTDSLFLNDPSERKNFYTILKQLLDQWNHEAAAALKKRYFSQESSVFESLTDANPADEKMCRYFVLSCSMEKDSLPMWNYYTHRVRAAGYNIHLDTAALLHQMQMHPVVQMISEGESVLCHKIIYEEEQKQAELGKLLFRFREKWELCCKEEEREHLMMLLDKSFERLSLFYKDGAFAHEKELRIVLAASNGKLHKLPVEDGSGPYRFRSVRGVQVPCLALDVLEKGTVIRGVTTGPVLDKELAVNGVEYMLYYYGFPQTCKVSSVPLRY